MEAYKFAGLARLMRTVGFLTVQGLAAAVSLQELIDAVH